MTVLCITTGLKAKSIPTRDKGGKERQQRGQERQEERSGEGRQGKERGGGREEREEIHD